MIVRMSLRLVQCSLVTATGKWCIQRNVVITSYGVEKWGKIVAPCDLFRRESSIAVSRCAQSDCPTPPFRTSALRVPGSVCEHHYFFNLYSSPIRSYYTTYTKATSARVVRQLILTPAV